MALRERALKFLLLHGGNVERGQHQILKSKRLQSQDPLSSSRAIGYMKAMRKPHAIPDHHPEADVEKARYNVRSGKEISTVTMLGSSWLQACLSTNGAGQESYLTSRRYRRGRHQRAGPFDAPRITAMVTWRAAEPILLQF